VTHVIDHERRTAMRVLTIVETAHRATLEEQDDTVLWLSRAFLNAGADLTVLLRGNAVNYAVRQTCAPLHIGAVTIKHPARPNEDIAKARAKGAAVHVVGEDLDERGIDKERCIAEATRITRAEVVELMEQHDQIWHW
jgi:sulfur transfer complex TusBCD TusB component (DsrH family)